MEEMQFKLEITLPYWLDLPNDFQFKIGENENIINVSIKQLDWKIYFFKENRPFHSIISETKLIDKHNFNFKQEIEINPEETISPYMSIKEKTKIEYLFILNNISDNLIYETWQFIKKETTRFLKFYSYYRILSTENQNHREFTAPLTDKYYTSETVQFYIRNNDHWELFNRAPIVLRLGHVSNFPAFQLKHDSLSYLKDVMEKNYNFRTEQNLLIQVSEASIHKNINNLVISTDIYLEFIVARFLERNLNLSKSKLNKEFQEKGFNHFMKKVLPNYLNGEEAKFIGDCIELHDVRNKIIHLTEDFSTNDSINTLCKSSINLIKVLKEKMSSEYPTFKLDKSIIGFVKEVADNNEVQVQILESSTQMRFIQSQPSIKNTPIYLPEMDLSTKVEVEITDEILKQNSKIIKIENSLIFVFSFTPYNEEEFSHHLERIENYIETLSLEKKEIVLYPLGFLYPKNYKKQINDLEIRLSEKYKVKSFFNMHIDKIAVKLNEFFKDKEDFVEESEIVSYLHKIDPYFQPYYLYFLYQNILRHKNENNTNFYKWKGLKFTLYEEIKEKVSD